MLNVNHIKPSVIFRLPVNNIFVHTYKNEIILGVKNSYKILVENLNRRDKLEAL